VGAGVQFTVHHSGTPYRKDTLAAQARRQVAAPSAGLNNPGKGTGGLSRRAPTLALTGCVGKVAGLAAVHAGEVKLVDQAQFQGRPATVIVVQATPAQPGTVYVAGAGCSASRADILARAPFPPIR
jgi:cell wall-associated NlpC family hydrolase